MSTEAPPSNNTSAPGGYVFIHAKPPWAGFAKTRLTPAVGAEGAAALTGSFLQDIWATVKSMPWARTIVLIGYGTREALTVDSEAEVWVGAEDLEQRGLWAFEQGFQHAPYVIQLPGDIPGIPARVLEAAHQALQNHEVVLGTDQDGTPYLISMRRDANPKMGGPAFLLRKTVPQLVQEMKQLGVNYAILEDWFDVDKPEDLDRLYDLMQRGEAIAPHTARTLQQLGFSSGKRYPLRTPP